MQIAPRCKHRAFTLVELLVTTTIIGFVTLAAAAFTIEGLKIYYNDSDRLLMNHDMRRFTQMMAGDAVCANSFYLYPDFKTRTDGGKDAYLVDGQNGQSGDFLVLVLSKINVADGSNTVTQVIGYYRVITDAATNTGTVYRFSSDSTNTGGYLPCKGNISITTILNNIMPTAKQNANPVFLPSVIGTSATTNPAALFYNYAGNAIMVKAKVQEQGNQNQTKALDTYNLTIQPRG